MHYIVYASLRLAALHWWPRDFDMTSTATLSAILDEMIDIISSASPTPRLLLSGGKPNDVDTYGGRYGIEDTRQAVAEARLQGLMPFCLTVDREAPAYLPTIFGPGGFAVLSGPELLPTVLVEVLRSLVTR